MSLTLKLVKVNGKEKPGKRSAHSTTTNENNTKAFIFGGHAGSKRFNDIWVVSCLYNLSQNLFTYSLVVYNLLKLATYEKR